MIVVSPPFFSPDAPLLGSSTLYDMLIEAGVSARYIDLNLLFFQKILTNSEILSICNDGKMLLEDENRSVHRRRLLLLAMYIVERNFDEFQKISLRLFQHQSNPDEDRKFYKYVNMLLFILGEKFYPTSLSFYHYGTCTKDIWEIENTLKYLDDKEHNITYYVIPDLLRKIEGVEGISENTRVLLSASFQSQVIPTLTIAKALKEKVGCKVHVGGQIVQRLGLSKYQEYFRFVDTFEDTLNADFKCDECSITPFRPEYCHLPSFRNIKLGDYFNSKVLLPLKVSNGCYWSKCSFCAIHHPFSGLCGLTDVDRVIQYIQYQRKTQNIDLFWFVDEALPKEWLELFICRMRESEMELKWALNGSRFESNLDYEFFCSLREAGCCAISFGLESYSQDVLNRMNKGVLIQDIQRTINMCAKAGIQVLASAFFGFPGETLQSIKQTKDFLSLNSNKFRYVLIGKFQLEKLSPIGRDPEKWGIGSSDYYDPGPLSPYYEYTIPQEILKESNKAIKEIKNLFRDPLAANVLYMDSLDVPSKTCGNYVTVSNENISEVVCIPESTVAEISEMMRCEFNPYQWDARLLAEE